MKKNIPLAIILFLLFTVSQPIHAQTLTPTPTNAIKTKPQTNSLFDLNLPGNTTLQQIIFKWFGNITPAGNQLPIPDLSKKATWLSGVSEYFTTGIMQKMRVHDTTPQKIQGVTTLCVYDVQNPGTLVGTQTSTDTYSADDKSGPVLLENGSLLNSLQGQKKLGSLDFTQQPVILDPAQAGGCAPESASNQQESVNEETTGQNTFGGPTIGQSVMNFVFNITADILKILNGGKTVTQHGIANIRQLVPNSEKTAANIAPVSDSDVAAAPVSDSEKKDLVQTGGFTQGYLAGSQQDFSNTNGDSLASYVETITGQTHAVKAKFSLTKLVDDALTRFSCRLTPGSLQSDPGKCATQTTETGGWNCNTSVPEQTVTGLNLNTAETYVNGWYRKCPNATANAWGQCANDVIARSKAACIDPLFTLALWIHETGASNYQCSGAITQDFGVNGGGVPAENFSAQLNAFLQLPSAYARRCPKTVNDFFSQYGPSPVSGMPPCYNQAPNKAAIENYAALVQTIYSALGGGSNMPYPIISGCTPSFSTPQ